MSFSSGNTVEDDQFIDDSIVLVMMSCAALLEVYHNMTDEEKQFKSFVRRKRRCVSDIFKELGPYWVKRSYRMTEDEFWKLFNIIHPYYPKSNKSKRT